MHILNALYRERILYWEPEANLDSSHSYSLLVHASSTYVIFNQFLGNFGLKLCIFYVMKFNHETGSKTLRVVQKVTCMYLVSSGTPHKYKQCNSQIGPATFSKGLSLVSIDSMHQYLQSLYYSLQQRHLFKYSPSPFKIVSNQYFFSPPENAPIPGIVPLIESLLLCFRQSLLTTMQCFHISINQCIMSEALWKSAVTNIPIYSNRIYCNGLCIYDTYTHIYIYVGT